MMKYLLALLAILGTSQSFAEVYMIGKSQTYIGVVYLNYTGEKDNSLSGNDGFGLNITSTRQNGHFRLIYGGLLSGSDGAAYVATTRFGATMYSVDAVVGFAIYPLLIPTKVRPFLEAAGLGGFKYIDLVNPPAGADSPSSGLAYGYRLSIGMETSYRSGGPRFTVDYISQRSKILSVSEFRIDAFGASVGWFF